MGNSFLAWARMILTRLLAYFGADSILKKHFRISVSAFGSNLNLLDDELDVQHVLRSRMYRRGLIGFSPSARTRAEMTPMPRWFVTTARASEL